MSLSEREHRTVRDAAVILLKLLEEDLGATTPTDTAATDTAAEPDPEPRRYMIVFTSQTETFTLKLLPYQYSELTNAWLDGDAQFSGRRWTEHDPAMPFLLNLHEVLYIL